VTDDTDTLTVYLTRNQIATIKECIGFSEDKIRNFDYTYGQYTEERWREGEQTRKASLASLQDAKAALPDLRRRAKG